MNRHVKSGPRVVKIFYYYSGKTGFTCLFDKNKRQYRTGFRTKPNQGIDIKTNNNLT